MPSRSITAVGIMTFLAVVAPWVLWTAIQTYVFGACDSKFGCAGGVMFAAQLSALAGLLSAIAAVTAHLLLRRFGSRRPVLGVGTASAIAGLCLAALLATVAYWPLGIAASVGAWLLLSLAITGGLLWLAR
jgi:hypothetical protein